jgi:hypothetical protein
MKDWEITEWIVFIGVAVLLLMCIAAIVQGKRHDDFLKAHGCQLLTVAPTGRQVYCGKACFRPELVYVYECVDGTKTEVR